MGKVRAPAQSTTSMKNDKDRAGSYLGLPPCLKCVYHSWMEGTPSYLWGYNYHLFRFTVPFPTYLTLKEEVDGLKYQERERQVEMSRLVARMGKFEKR